VHAVSSKRVDDRQQGFAPQEGGGGTSPAPPRTDSEDDLHRRVVLCVAMPPRWQKQTLSLKAKEHTLARLPAVQMPESRATERP
jgi:hypothetical protein